MWKLTTAVAAANTAVVDVAAPPSGFVTTRYVAVAPGEPSVQVAAIVVAAVTVVVPQVPLAVLNVVTAPVAKPVPVTANDVVVPALPVAGATDVIVGAASMTKPAGATAVAFAEPPLAFVTV
jgi:hypothetical protein